MLRVALSNQVNFCEIRYTTDGSAPTPTSKQYVQPLEFAKQSGVRLRAATFESGGFDLAAPRTRVLDASTLLSRDGNELASCSNQPGMRVSGSRPAQGSRPVYQMDAGNMCWLWHQVPLAGIGHVTLSVARVAWRFGDEAPHAVVRPKASSAGEFEIRANSCTGPLLARLPLAPAVGTIEQRASVSSAPGAADGADLCIFATGDPREGQWALARVAFSS
jgi:hexosaminidase